MHITATLVVPYPIEDVWAFVADPHTAPQWDRSVASVQVTPSDAVGVGTLVETTSPAGKRQTFQIETFAPPHQLTFALQRSPIFQRATLSFHLTATNSGTTIEHHLDLAFHWWARIIALVLRLTQRQALATDLALLRAALDRALGSAHADTTDND
ncbi:MAG TPA: SRPBCC family protein [Herpetosiphonaceae bacterium]